MLFLYFRVTLPAAFTPPKGGLKKPGSTGVPGVAGLLIFFLFCGTDTAPPDIIQELDVMVKVHYRILADVFETYFFAYSSMSFIPDR